MSISKNQLLTFGAVAFAGFAVWYITKGAGAPIAAMSGQPAQQQRDSALVGWMNGWAQSEFDHAALMPTGALNPFDLSPPNGVGFRTPILNIGV